MNPEYDARLIEEVAKFYADPLGFVIFAYPWDSDPALQLVELPAPYNMLYSTRHGPDKWACDFLHDLGVLVRERGFDGRFAVDAIRMAVASGHGIGKSALVAWLVDWIMSTRRGANGVVTANTSPQLETKTWPEIVKWTKRCITGHWFDISAGRGAMKMAHRSAPESWKCVAQTCREENAEAFAGLHAADSTPFFIFDEASAIPDKIAETAEGGLTDGEPMFFKFGNPTRNSGAFFNAFHGRRHRWNTRQIDSRNVAITNKAQIAQWIEDYGVDSDFVKVRVRGIFPSASARQFISVADVDAAFGRQLRPEQYQYAPRILSCDPAWEGDDMLEIGLRQGLKFQILRTIPKNDNDVQVANLLARLEDEHKADAVFIDGGYGTGIVSAGRTMGRDWMLVWFSGKSDDEGCINKRAEMWNNVKRWLKEGGALDPTDHQLRSDLISPEAVPRLDGKIQLESKADMKARGLLSPGRGDALALTFAYPVVARSTPQDALRGPVAGQGAVDNVLRDYDPFAR